MRVENAQAPEAAAADPKPEGIVAVETRSSLEVARRRTFAIISHPDAGKTTLTEKFLLYSGQLAVAGAVRGRKTERAATSDWMEMERQRGISISSTVLSFSYRGLVINLLDTPGHRDFSEDTYRTLAAADSAVMVIDAAKGIEEQTRKLFQVCAVRGIPILTFINKMDRDSRDPMGLLGEIEKVLGIDAVPLNWPLGLGDRFTGVYDRLNRQILGFQPGERGSVLVPTQATPVPSLDQAEELGISHAVVQELELLDEACRPFDRARFLAGGITPVFFGSAMNNFGVEPFLQAFTELAPPPGQRGSSEGTIQPEDPLFAGQVFKIQANLNPRHRDRIAFVRVCRGRFTPETELSIARTGEKLRIKGSHKLFARDREEVEEAFPGDILGLASTGNLRLGDTLCEGKVFHLDPLPRFSPECFALAICPDPGRRKQFANGLEQLANEGAVQVFLDPEAIREPILAAVGELQFDVVRYRLRSEYGVDTEIRPLPFKAGAWVGASMSTLKQFNLTLGVKAVTDHRGDPVLLAENAFSIRYLTQKYPEIGLRAFSDNLFGPPQ